MHTRATATATAIAIAKNLTKYSSRTVIILPTYYVPAAITSVTMLIRIGSLRITYFM